MHIENYIKKNEKNILAGTYCVVVLMRARRRQLVVLGETCPGVARTYVVAAALRPQAPPALVLVASEAWTGELPSVLH